MTTTTHTELSLFTKKVCTEQNLTCLHAIESGSRAWGFASFDSDFDVRLIYAENPEYYWQIFKGKDTFEFIDNELYGVPFDIGGWELQKALQLLYKSNSVILEWINSPIVYHSNDDFMQELKALQYEFFNAKSSFYHYQGMAKNAYATLNLDKDIKLKKYFYLLRALLASVWVKIHNTPIRVTMLEMAQILMSDELAELQNLIQIKIQSTENYTHTLSPILKNLITRLWQLSDELAFGDIKQGDVRKLNDLFKRTVEKL